MTPLADSTDATGNASANWTLGPSAIGQSATATVTGLAPIVFNATGTADTSRVLTVLSGNFLKVATGATTTVTIKVTDQYLNLIANAPINWNDSTSGGGAPTAVSGVTAADGTASTTWRMGARAGVHAPHQGNDERRDGDAHRYRDRPSFSDVQAGKFHVCGLSTNSRIYCWGLNDVRPARQGDEHQHRGADDRPLDHG